MTLSNTDHAKMHNALETASAIMKEPAVVKMAGYAYWTDDVEIIQRGNEALKAYEPNPTTHAARYRNEQKLTLAGKAVDMADILLERNGFQEVKGESWTDQDQQVIKDGLKAFRQATQHCRN